MTCDRNYRSGFVSNISNLTSPYLVSNKLHIVLAIYWILFLEKDCAHQSPMLVCEAEMKMTVYTVFSIRL